MSSLGEARDRALLYIRLLPLDAVGGVRLALEALEGGSRSDDAVATTMASLVDLAPSPDLASPVPPLVRGAVVPEELETSPLRAFLAGRRRRLAHIARGRS